MNTEAYCGGEETQFGYVAPSPDHSSSYRRSQAASELASPSVGYCEKSLELHISLNEATLE